MAKVMHRGLLAAALAAAMGPGLARAQTVAPPPPPQASQDVVVRAGDVVNVVIWREPDLSGAFPVNEAGRVVLPLLGERQVGGMAAGQVQQLLMRGYSEQLRNPSINVTLLRRVNVLGEVNRPGLYNVDPTITLAGIIATAGGITPVGDPRRVQVVRAGQTLLNAATPETSLASIDVRSDDQVFVGRRSWFDRNSGTVVTSLVSAALSIVTTIILTTK
jgi:protein involved in polysaccharide export with SLBB domain